MPLKVSSKVTTHSPEGGDVGVEEEVEGQLAFTATTSSSENLTDCIVWGSGIAQWIAAGGVDMGML